jgi:hypothetical protein
MTTTTPHPPEPEPPAMTLAADDEPGLSDDEYWEQRRALEAKLLTLIARRVASQHFPRWLYHADRPSRIVATRAERQALGPGWSVTPV